MSVRQARQLEALERILSNPSEDPIKLSYPVIETITQDFAVEIGRGGFGVVYLVRFLLSCITMMLIPA